MKALTVFYDARCGLCREMSSWLGAEGYFIPLHFVPYDSRWAGQLFPGIEDFHPEEEMLVLSDEGGLYRGGDAMIICLWATIRFRPWSLRLASPSLRPLAVRLCQFSSRHRYSLSQLLCRKSDAEIANLMEQACGREWKSCRL